MVFAGWGAGDGSGVGEGAGDGAGAGAGVGDGVLLTGDDGSLVVPLTDVGAEGVRTASLPHPEIALKMTDSAAAVRKGLRVSSGNLGDSSNACAMRDRVNLRRSKPGKIVSITISVHAA